MRRKSIGARWVFAATLLSGCTSVLDLPDIARTGPCDVDSSCAARQSCIDGMCRDQCSSNEDCEDGNECTPKNEISVCLPFEEEGGAPGDTGADGATDAPEIEAADGSRSSPDVLTAEVSADGAEADASFDRADATGAEPDVEVSDGGVLDADAGEPEASDGGVLDADAGEPEAPDGDAREADTADSGVWDGPGILLTPVGDGEAGSPARGCGCADPDAGCANRIVLFGGIDVPDPSDETWQWDGSQWSQLAPATHPTGRWQSAMATLCGRAVMFGGATGFGAPFSDEQWEWDGTTWTPQFPSPLPPARMSASTAVLNGSFTMFGGNTNDLQVLATTFDDTWTWDGTIWTGRSPHSSPSRRGSAAMAALGGRAVLFGGLDDDGNTIGDTWIWNGSDWTELHPNPSPPARSAAIMVTLRDRIVLFGGTDGFDALGDTWTWDGSAWTEEHPQSSPDPRSSASAATLGGQVVLFGGVDSDGVPFGDTWIWSGTDWTHPAVTGPSPRFGSAMGQFEQ